MKIIDLGKATFVLFLIIFGTSLLAILLMKMRPIWNEQALKITRDGIIVGLILWYVMKNHLVKIQPLNFKLDGMALVAGLIVVTGATLLAPDEEMQLLPYQFLQIVVFAPIMEEVICRGVIFGNYAANHLMLATIVSTVIFVGLHFSRNPVDLLEFTLVSLILCCVQFTTGNVFNCIMIHSLLNIYLLVGNQILKGFT
ncbi:CPBP family intramembrane metalloprotease [Fructilactobacillus hinvesii]|uniref:CPBP family intramembrane metalloprotease n=1 Tax=Fructilactobacillus hinvesii TaxID=2940300 RepID=A0ABY5BW95_9LACO|nr:CPBP family intramembrane glutamic endopeptidase [Fructilactobacillus hinvesii]USS88251.1 CPBP family intramembrane metalloprotease [Fructilactobacillus hinvesii]